MFLSLLKCFGRVPKSGTALSVSSPRPENKTRDCGLSTTIAHAGKVRIMLRCFDLPIFNENFTTFISQCSSLQL
ncbi:hypothetical protein GILI108418_09770 [Gillisia limnaea]|uniref:Uncharacterized protein n=1 Tax=Gillisia limnaea (strain DSM 15749 / LMG 21470 / R-8282) TaxID=865937 RepID=H2BT26_GILLR|nr:hypothetical protein Gilli_1943 [Gillisia limnaea DSM 15749]